VVEELDPIARTSGYPRSITCDNGPVFWSRAFDQWAHLHRVRIDYIRPGKQVENGFIESFNARLRDECLNLELFWSIEDAKIKLDAWRADYNTARPHSGLGNLAPVAFPVAAAHPVTNNKEPFRPRKAKLIICPEIGRRSITSGALCSECPANGIRPVRLNYPQSFVRTHERRAKKLPFGHPFL
jgi:hypothetical protein